MEKANEQQDIIPESRAARWAWRVSLIPLLGVPLFILLAFIALYRIGSKGRTGFWLLRRGAIVFMTINVVAYFGVYLFGYSGYFPEVYNRLYSYLPKHGVFVKIDKGKTEATEFEYWKFGKEHGTWTTLYSNGKKGLVIEYKNGLKDGLMSMWFPNGQLCYESPYINGQHEGIYTVWHENGKKSKEGIYKNNKQKGKWSSWDVNGQLEKEDFYDDSGNLIKTEEYIDGKPIEVKP